MSVPGRLVLGALPDPVLRTLADFERSFGATLRLTVPARESGAADEVLYASREFKVSSGPICRSSVPVASGPTLELEVLHAEGASTVAVASALSAALVLAFESAREVQFFSEELSERFEEINLLYSISETLGSTLDFDSGARKILSEVRDVLGAKRGSLWVHRAEDDRLHLAAAVGADGRVDPIDPDDPDAITSMVFREGRAVIASRRTARAERQAGGGPDDSFLSVPIRYSPGSGQSRTVGVINLIGRLDGSRFSTANQKLLTAIASQVGAAIENHRLVREGLSKERMTREMELAHDLQMKLLPPAEKFPFAEAAARVEPTQQVGGDFYQLFGLPGDRVGVMLGDVSLHGFPSALIMTLAMSASAISAREADTPAEMLRKLDDALSDELSTTEMYLTAFYGVIDAAAGVLTYSNAGHAHAFVVRADGRAERLAATDPPVGFAGPDSYRQESVPWHSPEDLLVLFTDGLPDAISAKDRVASERLLLDAVVRNRKRPAREVIDALFEVTPKGEPSPVGDDRTALVVRR